MLKVEAICAQDLKKYDVLGKSDPFLEVFTLPLHKVRTACPLRPVSTSYRSYSNCTTARLGCKCPPRVLMVLDCKVAVGRG